MLSGNVFAYIEDSLEINFPSLAHGLVPIVLNAKGDNCSSK